MVYVGAFPPVGTHAHHATQVFISPTQSITLANAAGRSIEAKYAIIPANVPHSVRRGAADVVSVFLDAEVGDAVPGPSSDEPKDWLLAGQAVAELNGPLKVANWDDANGWTRGLSPTRPPAQPSRQVRRALSSLTALIEAGEPVRLDTVSPHTSLSSRRLRHVFRQELGVTFRAYVRWLRIQRAARAFAAGASLTDAAHISGFTDSAHLNRVFKSMFGISPSLAMTTIEWHVAQD